MGNTMVEAAVGVVAAAVAGGIFVCSVFVASCGNMEHQRTAPGAVDHGVGSDDNRESLEKRIQTYLESTKPIIDLYEEMGKVKKIDASKSVDEVFGDVMKIFDKEG